jgi:heavy metal efflux system protein
VGFSALESEQRVTFAIGTALAGVAHLDSTRLLSRYGFSQATAVFDGSTDICFAHQQVSERLQQVRLQLPAGIEPQLSPVATGLGETFWVYSAKPG